MPTLLIRGPDGTLVEKELVGRLTVGCDDDNDLVWRTGGIEKRHANFFAEGGEVVLEDFSAAKTIVDGEPLAGRRKLKPGVRVVIGDYEVQLKEQQVTVRKIEAPVAPPAAFPFKLVFGLLGVASIGVVAVGLWKLLPEEQPVAVVKPNLDPCADLEKFLRVAREACTDKGLAAVEETLKCDPLNDEANQLKRRCVKELAAQPLAVRAREFVELGRDEQALEQLEKIPAGTEVALKAQPLLDEVSARVAKEAKKECDEYGKAGKKALAQPRCELAERLTRKKPEAPKGPSLSERMLARVREPALVEALVLYADGRVAEATTRLQAIRERSSMAGLHATAEAMRKDVANADGLFKIGEHALEKGELDRAASAFKEALAYDAKLVPEGGTALKKNVEQLMSVKAYELGVVHAQHQNWPRACATWKVGFGFYKGKSELNQAVANDCTRRAHELLSSDACKDLDDALALAVPGDDLEPQIQAKRAARGCRP